jgi:hypothetical protein
LGVQEQLLLQLAADAELLNKRLCLIVLLLLLLLTAGWRLQCQLMLLRLSVDAQLRGC